MDVLAGVSRKKLLLHAPPPRWQASRAEIHSSMFIAVPMPETIQDCDQVPGANGEDLFRDTP